MVNDNAKGNSGVGREAPHSCGPFCLGPLTFHPQAAGSRVRMSKDCLRAKRRGRTFRDGVVFSSRPVKLKERVRLRVDQSVLGWHGALRLGFTSVPPGDRSLPLPSMAIPDLTHGPGHWAAAAPESSCQAGAELQFWVSSGGSVYFSSHDCTERRLLTGVDVRKPLWAMIDIYGQTRSVSLLGSERRGLLCTRTSCPPPKHLTQAPVGDFIDLFVNLSPLSQTESDRVPSPDTDVSPGEECVVCTETEATLTLPCGHRCLCGHCYHRVLQDFGTCPLCRYAIRWPSLGEGCDPKLQ